MYIYMYKLDMFTIHQSNIFEIDCFTYVCIAASNITLINQANYIVFYQNSVVPKINITKYDVVTIPC